MVRNTVHVDTSSVSLPTNLFDKTSARSSTSSALHSLLPPSLPTVSASSSFSTPNSSLTMHRSDACYPRPFQTHPDSAYESFLLYGLRCDTIKVPQLFPTDPAEVPNEEDLDDIHSFRLRSIPLSLLALEFSRMTGSHDESPQDPNREGDGKEETSTPLARFILPPLRAAFLLPGRADVLPVRGARQAPSATPAETAIPFGLGFSVSNANPRRRQKSRKRSKSLCLPDTSFGTMSTCPPLKTAKKRPLGKSPALNQGSFANPVSATTERGTQC